MTVKEADEAIVTNLQSIMINVQHLALKNRWIVAEKSHWTSIREFDHPTKIYRKVDGIAWRTNILA